MGGAERHPRLGHFFPGTLHLGVFGACALNARRHFGTKMKNLKTRSFRIRQLHEGFRHDRPISDRILNCNVDPGRTGARPERQMHSLAHLIRSNPTPNSMRLTPRTPVNTGSPSEPIPSHWVRGLARGGARFNGSASCRSGRRRMHFPCTPNPSLSDLKFLFTLRSTASSNDPPIQSSKAPRTLPQPQDHLRNPLVNRCPAKLPCQNRNSPLS